MLTSCHWILTLMLMTAGQRKWATRAWPACRFAASLAGCQHRAVADGAGGRTATDIASQ